MGRNTGIDWTDHTWNPWQGCRKVSPGCANCYMYRDKRRFGQDPATVIRSKTATFNAPLKWKDPAKVFVCSWSDFFIEDADQWRDEAWMIMRKTPNFTYQLLTKRPENIKERLPKDWPFKNVWIGVTAENQEMANKRIPFLLCLPAEKRFVSIEPMIGPVNLDEAWLKGWKDGRIIILGNRDINWVICGGESGPNAREIKEKWVFELMNQCDDAKVAFFMKQMSGKKPIPEYLKRRQFPR